MSETKSNPPNLDENFGDLVARTTGFVAASVIPGVGSAIQYAITELIPNSRIERIVAYLRYLEQRIDQVVLQNALRTAEGLDLFEEGLWQAARALSDERKERIAGLVASGLKAENLEKQQCRHFLRILNQLDDAEIILLVSHLPRFQVVGGGSEKDKEFRRTHREIIGPFSQEISRKNHDLEMASLKEARCYHLASFGLLVIERLVQGKVRFILTPAGTAFMHFLEVAED